MERDENIHSIQIRLEEAKIELSKAKDNVQSIKEELRNAMQQDFEQRLGVKEGDIITTRQGTKYYYERFIIDAYGCISVLCHPQKNDGTASKAIRHIFYKELIRFCKKED